MNIYNFLRILQDLASDDPVTVDLKWLEESYRDPQTFWREIFNFHSSTRSIFARSSLLKEYDFYHDIVVRNFSKERIAFRWYEEGLRWQQVSYQDLHFQVVELEQTWMKKGLTEGQIVCLMLPMGLKYLVSLLTALKMGLIVSFLPIEGDLFIQKRLRTLKPNAIVTDLFYAPLVKEFEKLIIDNQPDQKPKYDVTSHVYSSNKPMGLIFSPVSSNPHIPKFLSCDAAYLHAVRDGILAFSINGGCHFAAPGLNSLQDQPWLLLSTLLCGGTYVHLTLQQIEADAGLLDQFPLTTLGISDKLRNLLLRIGKKTPASWGHWFRNCAQPLDWNKWQMFMKSMVMENIPASNIFWDAGHGGSLLFSMKRKGTVNHQVLPSPGIAWQLVEFNRSGEKARGNCGLLACDDKQDKFPAGSIMLSKQANEWLYIGTFEPRRDGKTALSEEILEVVSALPFVAQCSQVNIPVGDQGRAYHFVLLVFVGMYVQEEIDELKSKWIRDINTGIQLHLGEEFLPDVIEFYPLYARKKDNAVDHTWCETQYLTGTLFRKSHLNIYKELTLLRTLALSKKS